jgi:hypothetical protein
MCRNSGEANTAHWQCIGMETRQILVRWHFDKD